MLGKPIAVMKRLEQNLSAPYLATARVEDNSDHIRPQGKNHRKVVDTHNTMNRYRQPLRPNPGVCTPDLHQIAIQDVDEMTLVEDRPNTLCQVKLGGRKSPVQLGQ